VSLSAIARLFDSRPADTTAQALHLAIFSTDFRNVAANQISLGFA